MPADCFFLNPLQRDGTSQNQRLAEALVPSYVAVDERSLSDLLVYARRYARLLRYYTPDNVGNGDWVAFIEQDISTLVSIVAVTEYTEYRDAFDALVQQVEDAAVSDKADALAALFPPIAALAAKMDRWYGQSIKGLALRSGLYRYITSVLTDAYRSLIAYALRLEAVGVSVTLPTTGFSEAWSLVNVQSDLSLFQSGTLTDLDEIEEATKRVAAVFDQVYEVLVNIVTKAPEYLQETLDNYADHQPHMALFITFLLLFQHAQNHLNEITEKHLLFYYQEVLQLDYRPEQPDEVHIIFGLAKNFFAVQVPEGTYLKAGKDDLGKNLFYATDHEIVVNEATLHETHGLKTIFLDKTEDATYGTLIHNIYAAPVAHSANGLGAEIEEEDGKWLTFGGVMMPYAEIGFAIASPMLLLSEGTRTITLIFAFDALSTLITDQVNIVASELQHNVKVYATGAKAWVPVTVENVAISTADNTITYTLSLPPDVEPIVPFNPDKLAEGFDTHFPVFKFILDNKGYSAEGFDLHLAADLPDYDTVTGYAAGDYVYHDGSVFVAKQASTHVEPGTSSVTWEQVGSIAEFDEDKLYNEVNKDFVRYGGAMYRAKGVVGKGLLPDLNPAMWEPVARSYPYKYLHGLALQKLTMDVAVSGMRSLILENDQGTLNSAKPFMPFGPQPKVGSSLYIGSHEVFQKRLAGTADPELMLEITWGDLPSESFDAHYTAYNVSPLNNNAFKVDLEVLRDGDWARASNQALFSPSSTTLAPDDEISFTLNDVLIDRRPLLDAFAGFKRSLERGFLRLYLQKDFYHALYPKRLAEEAVKNNNANIPNQPYTPLITSISLSYHAQEVIDYAVRTRADFEDRVEQFFHIYPFGQVECFPIDDDGAAAFCIDQALVPSFTVTKEDKDAGTSEIVDAEGTLYLGIDRLKPPQNLAVLFQVAEGSADPEKERQEVVWSYLAGGAWVDFKSTEILSDTTNGLLTSGIIQFATPKTMTDTGTAWPTGLFWIKASVAEETEAVSKLIAVMPQAVKASYENQDNDPNYLATALPGETIGKLKTRQAAIKTVLQPFASFNGRVQEQEEAFYIRVSERLRHKQRAVTIFDYERLVLEAFPEVYKVKCINHTDLDSEYAPGAVKVIVVPNLRNKNAVDPLQPRVPLNTLEAIQETLRQLASDFVALEVKNPQYEQVRVDFKVTFYPGFDKGFYTQKLSEDVVKFLSPWLYEEGEDLSFGGRIHRSWILNFVEERSYVDFVTDFKLYHAADGVTFKEVEQAEASTSSSVLVSAAEHTIGDTLVEACQTVST